MHSSRVNAYLMKLIWLFEVLDNFHEIHIQIPTFQKSELRISVDLKLHNTPNDLQL